jgi:hypothetical protein
MALNVKMAGLGGLDAAPLRNLCRSVNILHEGLLLVSTGPRRGAMIGYMGGESSSIVRFEKVVLCILPDHGRFACHAGKTIVQD